MKKMIFTIVFFSTIFSYGQKIETYKLKTTVISGNGPFLGGLVPTLTIKGVEISNDLISKRNIKKYIVKQFNLQPPQYYYSKFLKGEIDRKVLMEVLNIFETDTSNLSRNTVKQDVRILVGETFSGDKFYAIDLNHDQSFAEEHFIYYVTKNNFIKPDKIPEPKLTVEVYYKHKLITKQINIKPYPYKSAFKYRDSVDNYLYLMMKSNEYKKATLLLEKNVYDIAISNESPSIYYTSKKTVIYIMEKGKGFDKKYQYRIGDSVYINKYVIYIKEIDLLGDELIVEVYNKNTEIINGFRENEQVLNINTVSIDSVKVSLNDFRNRYILIDFWGTWCGPCKENIPLLRAMHKKFLNKEFVIIGIASDKELSLVRNYVNIEAIKWLNVFDSFENPAIVKTFRVEIFPTYLLIDKNGKIVIRAEGKDGLLKIDKYLDKILK